ncbi:MAG: hypothetical protein ACOC9W_05000 [Persicimonas sp.]
MNISRLWIPALLIAAVAFGCDDTSKSDAQSGSTKADYTTEGELVFSDDFERAEIGSDWVIGEGEDGPGDWRIEDGAVVGADIKNDPLWLDRPLPEEVRVEFDVQARSPVGDIKIEIFGDGHTHESGYVLIFGGWKNSLDVIARLDEHGNDRKSRETHGVVPGHTYRMAVERTDGTLEWYVDGEPFMTYEDPDPLEGEGHRHFAFNVWSAPVHFDNVAVYDLSNSR